MTLNVAVLGCGPTGLLAAHAVNLSGHKFKVFSNKRKSHLFGSQYLHEPIEGIVGIDEGRPVHYQTNGSPEEYRRKTHGKWWDGIVAPEDFESEHMSWNIREAYDRLWQKYGRDVVQYIVPKAPGAGRGAQDGIVSVDNTYMSSGKWGTTYDHVRRDLTLDRFDLVVSTIPRTAWKVDGEQFIFSEGWALGDAPENGQFVPFSCPDQTIICDGTSDVSWTRLSNVFGYTTVEWPHHLAKPPFEGVSRVTKPLRYQESPFMPNPANKFLHVGRYGQWEKGVVVTDAFNDVIKKIGDMA